MRSSWLSRWLPLIVGLGIGVLLARLVMDAMRDMEPAPAAPVVLVAGYLTCVLVAVAVTVSWRRISSGLPARGTPANADPTHAPTSPASSHVQPGAGTEAGGDPPADNPVERPTVDGSQR